MKEKKNIKIGEFIFDEGIWCPRCGWSKGKIFHCGLCEGHEEKIIEWLSSIHFVRFGNLI